MPRPLKRILYVEDDASIGKIVQIALESVGGFTVEACDSGAAALERAPAFRPDLILLDAIMSEMDGAATLRALRKIPETASTPVVFVTTKLEPRKQRLAERMGALDVIFKPFDPMRLSADIQRIWGAA